MMDSMIPDACDHKERICGCDLCTRRIPTAVTEFPGASPLDAGAREADTAWAAAELPSRRFERLVPRFHRFFTEA
jgi:hypothetical protein